MLSQQNNTIKEKEMEYKDDKFSLSIVGNKYSFFGKVEKSDYTELGKFLKHSAFAINSNELLFDFRNLEYLNSSGIRTIAVFFLDSSKKIKIYINENLTWQRVGIVPLEKMKDQGMIKVLK